MRRVGMRERGATRKRRNRRSRKKSKQKRERRNRRMMRSGAPARAFLPARGMSALLCFASNYLALRRFKRYCA